LKTGPHYPELSREGIHPDDRERVRALAREAREQGIPTRSEFRFVARVGRVVWVLDQTIPVRDEDGTIVCHQGFLLDITEQKQLEEQRPRCDAQRRRTHNLDECCLLRDGAFVAVEIADTGTGMDGETRTRVFEPFFTMKDTGKGKGLGLATAYGVVSQSGGRIEIDSALGQGSTFRVLLPAAA